MPLHIAMYPWLAMGHITSFLQLANKLADRGHKISFFVPPKTQSKIASLNHHHHLITFIPVPIPLVDGLPPLAETTNDVPPQSHPLIMTAMDLTRDSIESHLACLKPDIIFYDFTPWLPEIARSHGVKSVYFSTVFLIIFAYVSSRGRGLPANHSLIEADLVGPPPGFPCPDIRLRVPEARAVARICSMEFGTGMTFMERQNRGVEECDAMVGKSCREMEGAYSDFVEKIYGKSVFLAGPVIPEPPSSRLDGWLDDWLKGLDSGSVVYCAFGSECILDKDQFQELVLGLELTGRPFLAALRPPADCETIESALPEGFTERTKGRGILHGGWVQQQLILQHPSVGCFVTHCGAGSLSEALVSECQLVMMPQAVDQFINARMMSKQLKVGLEVDKRDSDGFFTKEAVRDAVSTVMDEECDTGKVLRGNHANWKAFLLREGLEEAYITDFIQNLRQLLD